MNNRQDNKHRFILWTVVLVAAITLIPFLGVTDFNSKGEPREAVVAVSMLNQHNWILPENNGVDIPYKPPFFQWCIAAFSLPVGHVTEFTSRLPSALALIIMLAMGAVFYAKRKSQDLSFLAAMLTLTSFEVHRAGTNARVDMVLTMFIVCGLYAFYRWSLPSTPSQGGGESTTQTGECRLSCKGLPWLAILCMSGATLTKGPVGIVLPCFVMFVFMLIENWRSASPSLGRVGEGLLKLFLSALLACIIPALWYYAAYQQGGKEFLDLVLDENVGRFLGKMKFVTHNNPWPYNIVMLISGWLPWSVPLLLSLFVLPWKKWLTKKHSDNAASDGHKGRPCKWIDAIKNADSVQIFTWLSFLLILFFYCIPKSKRGVYLLPCYPFMAVLIVEYAVWVMKRSKFPIRFYIGFLTIVGFLLTATLVVLRTGVVPDTIFHGKHAYENIEMLHALAFNSLGIGEIILLLLPLAAACLGLAILFNRKIGFITDRPVLASTFMTLLVFMSFDGYYRPTTLNTKSFRPFAEEVDKITSMKPGAKTPLYAFTGFPLPGSDPMRFYGVDFYLNDRVRQFNLDKPTNGLVIVNDGNDALLHKSYDKDYTFYKIYQTKHRETEFKDFVYVYSFIKKQK